MLERCLFRYFYQREHLDQVLLTFALILLFEETRSLIVGNDFYSVPVPDLFNFSVPITAGFSYSAYRFAVIGICLALAAAAVLLDRAHQDGRHHPRRGREARDGRRARHRRAAACT